MNTFDQKKKKYSKPAASYTLKLNVLATFKKKTEIIETYNAYFLIIHSFTIKNKNQKVNLKKNTVMFPLAFFIFYFYSETK